MRRIAACMLVCLLLGAALIVPPISAQDTNTITIGLTDLPTTLDPGEAYDFNAWEVLSHLYVGLTRQIPGTLDYELALASDVDVSGDKLTYTFTLREDAAFSDGTPITAQTFVDSINRVLMLKRDALQAVEPYVSSVEADADGKLVFHLTRPVPYFMALVALPPYFPQHPDLAGTDQPQPFPTALIGNGPYTLESFDVHERIVLTANPAYSPQPATETIVLQNFARSEDLREALRAHEIDLAWRALYLGHLIELEGTEGLQVVEVPSTRVFYLYFNHDREPFDDPAAREAVTMLIERGSAIEPLAGHVTALTSLIPAEFPDAYAPIWPDETDMAQAEAVLHAAGYRTRGQSMLNFAIGYSLPTYGTIHGAPLNQIVRRQLNVSEYVECSIFADIETSTLISAVERGEAAYAVFLGWTPLVPHPDAYLRPLAYSGEPIPANGKYAKTEVDRLLDAAALSDDSAEQGALYRDAADLLLADHDLIPLWQDHLQVMAWEDIEGIQIEANFFLHYDLLKRK